MTKKEFTGRYDWRVVLDVESAGAQVNLYEFATACTEADLWPGYSVNPEPLQPPTYLMFQEGAIA